MISEETLIGITESHGEENSPFARIEGDKNVENNNYLYTEESQFATKSFAHKAFHPTIH